VPKLNAPEQSFSLEVIKLAEHDNIKAPAKFTDLENPAGIIGNIIDSEPDTEIVTFDGTETFSQIRDKLNTIKEKTHVWAKIHNQHQRWCFDNVKLSKRLLFLLC